MSEPKTLARPYAIAAYQFAKNNAQLDAWQMMLTNLATLVSNEKIQMALSAPVLDAVAFLKLLAPVIEKTLDSNGVNFLKILIENHRLILAPLILKLFLEIKDAADNIVSVTFTTAISLTDIEQQQLVEKITQQLKQKVLPTFAVDPALIAGAIVSVGDAYVVDGSVKTQLTRLKTNFSF